MNKTLFKTRNKVTWAKLGKGDSGLVAVLQGLIRDHGEGPFKVAKIEFVRGPSCNCKGSKREKSRHPCTCPTNKDLVEGVGHDQWITLQGIPGQLSGAYLQLV